MFKFSISFEYLDLKSHGRKYIYADSEEEAIKIFEEIYRNYKTKIKEIRKIENKT